MHVNKATGKDEWPSEGHEVGEFWWCNLFAKICDFGYGSADDKLLVIPFFLDALKTWRWDDDMNEP